MKSVILKSFAVVMLALSIVSLTAQAQSADHMKANIPFSFTIGSQTLPAGEYTVRYVNQNSGKSALLFKSIDGRTSRIVNMNVAQAGRAEMKASLVFNQYGDSYFLSEVWTGSDQYGLSLPKSRAEREVKNNELSKLEARRVTVALTASR
ncbi:MAG TPA: hypothetical protein VJS44_12405 [Pyrinomonadaceae bacterium]|nr:hypothetical protein [Pyrinomonadaceae bacterium]